MQQKNCETAKNNVNRSMSAKQDGEKTTTLSFRADQDLAKAIEDTCKKLRIDKSTFLTMSTQMLLDFVEANGGSLWAKRTLQQSNLQVSTGKNADRIDTDVGKSSRRTG